MAKFIPTTIDEFLDERISFCEVGFKSDPVKWGDALSKLKYCKSLDRKFHSLQFRSIFNELINGCKDTIRKQLEWEHEPEKEYLIKIDQALTLLLQR